MSLYLRKAFGSDIAVGFYITSTIVLVPVAIYLVKAKTGTKKIMGAAIIAFYSLLSLVILGIMGQTYFGNGANVLIALLILLGLLIYLGPINSVEKPLPDRPPPLIDIPSELVDGDVGETKESAACEVRKNEMKSGMV